MRTDNSILTEKYLIFDIASEHYAVNVGRVREVLEYQDIIRVPRAPESMRGVINVRGGVVPVIDLHIKFSLDAAETTVDTSIVVIEVQQNEKIVLLGMIVDAVYEVATIRSDEIDATPNIGAKVDTYYLDGIGRYNENFVMILNIEGIISKNEMSEVEDI